jgi:hypothetical protein
MEKCDTRWPWQKGLRGRQEVGLGRTGLNIRQQEKAGQGI